MNTMRRKKRHMTLIEMMIVMFLIALITGVIAYNYRGTLEEGKAFKTKVAIEKLTTILNLEAAKNPSFLNNLSQWPEVVKNSPFAQNPNALLKDGWGGDFKVELHDNVIHVYSPSFDNYKKSQPTLFSNEGDQQ